MKKLFISLLTFLTLLCAFGLTACGEPEHKHNFVEQIITEENLASSVSCEEKAKYYYTCSCGKIGTETFEDGEALGHAFTDYKSDNNATFTEDGTKTAVCDREGCSKTHTITDEGSKLESYISFKTLNVHDLNVYGKVSNATYEFDFTEEIEVIGIYEYVVSLDFYGANQVLTKKVPLSVGTNVVYVFEMNGKDIVNTYQITIRRRPIHTVEFYYKNTFIESQQVEEDSFAVEPNQPTKAGYTFTGWDFDFNTAITGNKTVNATYTNNKNTEYRVEHYFENLEDDGYTLDSSITDTLTGETDTLATATPKDIAHFTYKATSTDSGNINGNGSTVLKVYYKRNRYNVVLNKLDNKGNVSGSGIYANAQEVVATATLNDGYNFLGWYEGEEQVSTSLTYSFNPTKDITLVAKWQANKNTEYRVEHYFENLEDDGYTLDSSITDTLTGETDTLATATPKDIAHFKYKETSTDSGNINGDGSTVLKVYYTRDKYAITINSNNAKAGTFTNASGNYKYEKEITVTATTKAGYTFLGWFDGDKCLCENAEYKFNVDKAITITAKWYTHEETPYKIEYYLQNLENDSYALTETTTDYGLTDTTATIEPKDITHFAFNEGYSLNVLESNINGDGSTVLKVYYTRNRYTITFNGNGGVIESGKATQTVKFGGSVIAPIYTKIGYTFNGFDKSLTNISESFTATANWKINQYTLTIVYGNGEKDKTITQDYNSVITETLPSNLERAGYGFDGWDKEMPVTMPAINTTITAKWIAIFNVSSGEITGLTTHGKRLTNIIIPSKIDNVNITSIDNYAFEYCNSLTSIVIGDSVTSIEEYAFIGCRSLTSIVIPNSVTSIGENAFDNCSSLTSIKVTENNNYYKDIDGNLYSKDGTTLLQYTIGKTDSSFIIPDSVTSIGENAFDNCDSLTSIEIPDSVTSIGDWAFSGCDSLTSIEIPDSVTSIGYSAFASCSSLTSVVIGDSVTSIGDWAFAFCDSLTSIVIPNSVTRIGDSAFYDCGSLTSIKYRGSQTQWRAINTMINCFAYTGNYTITYNYDGE